MTHTVFSHDLELFDFVRYQYVMHFHAGMLRAPDQLPDIGPYAVADAAGSHIDDIDIFHDRIILNATPVSP